MTRARLRALRVIAVAASSLGALGLATACSEESIVLATLPPGSNVSSPGEGQRCVEDESCGPSALCARRSCGDLAGACEPLPVVCNEDPSPVCGCDGVTYWNDCVRRAAGVTAMTEGECRGNAIVCGVKPSQVAPGAGPGTPGGPQVPPPGNVSTCPPNTFCARLLPPLEGPQPQPPPPDPSPTPAPGIECPVDPPGTCWALPAVCPAMGRGSDRWLACGPAEVGCKTTCDAIRSQEPHRRAKACQ